LAIEGSVGSVVVVIALPFSQLVIEQVDIVGYAILVQQLLELLVIHTV